MRIFSVPLYVMGLRGIARRWVLVAIALLVGLGIWILPPFITFYNRGLLTSDNTTRTYQGNRSERLKDLREALLLYQTSEGQFPDGAGWADAITPLVRSHDMSLSEAKKKFHDPSATGTEFGWALNDAVSGKYIGDIKDPEKTPLLFSTKVWSNNAHGNPKNISSKSPQTPISITVSGKVIQ